jgi:hypothetical protein
MRAVAASLRAWPLRRWVVAALVGVAGVLVVAVPTDLINTPLFHRDIPPEWWSWPALALSAGLAGLLATTYVASPGSRPATAAAQRRGSGERADRPARRGALAGLLTFFAVGCPVCNKFALLALGYAGALTWFRPFQPVLQLVAIVLLGWALRARLIGGQSCPARAAPEAEPALTTRQEP